jgi:hypothetical protein
MANSFFKRSARWGPTPFKYSMGWANMFGEVVINGISTKIILLNREEK